MQQGGSLLQQPGCRMKWPAKYLLVWLVKMLPHDFAGLGESALQELLAELSEDSPQCRVSVYCHDAGHLEVVTVGHEAPQRDAAIRERCAEFVLPDAGLAKSVYFEEVLLRRKVVPVALLPVR